jgi:hypothetical protein
LLVRWHAVVLGKRDQFPADGAEGLGHCLAAEATVEEEPKLLLEAS